MTTSSESRLHASSLLFGNRRTIEALLPSAVLVPTVTDAWSVWVVAGVLGAIAVAVLAVGLLRYLRFTYRCDDDELVVRSGILMRTVRTIPYLRIQTLDVSQNLVQRLLGVAVVHVQTGSGLLPEATLRVMRLGAVDDLRAHVLAAGGITGRSAADGERSRHVPAAPSRDADADGLAGMPAGPGDVGAAGDMGDGSGTASADIRHAAREGRVLLHLPPHRLLLAGFLENRGLVLIFGALALLQQGGMSDRIIVRLAGAEGGLSAVLARWLRVSDLAAGQMAVLGLAALLMLVVLIRLLSTVWAVVRLYDFRLTRVGDEFRTEYGLFTRVRATIPLRRVQTIVIRETRLHRLLGYRMVLVETAGGAMTDTSLGREALAPLIDAAGVGPLLQELGVTFDPAELEWQPVHPRAWRRMLAGSLGWATLLSAVAIVFMHEWAVLVVGVLLLNGLVRAALRRRHLGWSEQAECLVVRDGALVCDTRIVRFSRMQVVALNRNPFDLRSGMARVLTDSAGAIGRRTAIPFLPRETAELLQARLRARAAATPFTW